MEKRDKEKYPLSATDQSYRFRKNFLLIAVNGGCILGHYNALQSVVMLAASANAAVGDTSI